MISLFDKIKKISSLIIIIIILLLIILLIYKNTVTIDLITSLDDISYRWVFPLIVILIFSFSLFFNPTMKVFFLVNIFTILIALYLGEYILNKRTTSDLHKAFAKSQGRVFDLRSYIEVKNDMDKLGVITHAFSKGHFFKKNKKLFFSLASHSNTNIIHCQEAGEWVLFQSDEYGFNNPMGSFDQSFHQIVGIGDSFTSGYCLPDSFSFMSLVKKEYPLTINLGVTGTGPLHQLAILKEYIASLKPKVVLWNFFEGNDLQELAIEIGNPTLKKYLNNSYNQNLKEEQFYINQSITKKNKEKKDVETEPIDKKSIEKFIFLNGLRTQLGLYKQETKPNFDLTVLESIIIMARDFIENLGAEMIFVYIPSVERSYGFRGRHNINYQKNDIINIAKSLNISVIDISKSLEKHHDPLSLYNSRIGYHFNKSGNKWLSEIILDSLLYAKSLHE